MKLEAHRYPNEVWQELEHITKQVKTLDTKNWLSLGEILTKVLNNSPFYLSKENHYPAVLVTYTHTYTYKDKYLLIEVDLGYRDDVPYTCATFVITRKEDLPNDLLIEVHTVLSYDL